MTARVHRDTGLAPLLQVLEQVVQARGVAPDTADRIEPRNPHTGDQE